MRRVALLAALLATGCAYKVHISSVPSAAEVSLPGERGTVVTPAEVTMRWVPFGRQRIRVRAPGYRDAEIDLRRSEIRASRYITQTLFHPSTLAGATRGTVQIVLVPAHGPTGTWTQEEVP